MTCKDCVHSEICLEQYKGLNQEMMFRECKRFKNKADVVEVVRCKDCQYAQELDKHCDINRTVYKHCSLLRGEETNNVWHKYKKYYKDYSLVSLDDYCSSGEKRSEEE
jgi:hypothetical protein